MLNLIFKSRWYNCLPT